MNYRDVRLINSSDDSSDSEKQEIAWKRKLSDARRYRVMSPSDRLRQLSKEKRRRDKVWLKVTHERKLADNMGAAAVCQYRTEAPVIDLDQTNNTNQYTLNAKRRLGVLRWDPSIPRTHIPVNFQSPPDDVARVLIELLNESNESLIERVVQVLGVKTALEFYYLTEDVERRGGLICANGTQRRSPGGVYFNLIKNSPELDSGTKRDVFILDRRSKERFRRKVRRLMSSKAEARIDNWLMETQVEMPYLEMEEPEVEYPSTVYTSSHASPNLQSDTELQQDEVSGSDQETQKSSPRSIEPPEEGELIVSDEDDFDGDDSLDISMEPNIL